MVIVLVLFVGLIAYSCIVVGARADRQMDAEYIEWLKNKDKQPEVDEKAKKEAEKRKHNKSLIDKEQFPFLFQSLELAKLLFCAN